MMKPEQWFERRIFQGPHMSFSSFVGRVTSPDGSMHPAMDLLYLLHKGVQTAFAERHLYAIV
jgi:hypothetical protein